MRNLTQLRFRKGLTTIELIIVVAVIGFLFTITAVSIKNFIVPSSKDTSAIVQSSLIFAYNHALLNHKTVFFQLDMEKQEYQVFRVEREDDGIREEPITKVVSLPFNNHIFAIVDFGGRKKTEGIIRIPYSHDGTSWDVTLLMGEEGSVSKSIQVYRYGGKVYIKNGEDIRTTSRTLERIDYGVDDREDGDSQSEMNRY